MSYRINELNTRNPTYRGPSSRYPSKQVGGRKSKIIHANCFPLSVSRYFRPACGTLFSHVFALCAVCACVLAIACTRVQAQPTVKNAINDCSHLSFRSELSSGTKQVEGQCWLETVSFEVYCSHPSILPAPILVRIIHHMLSNRKQNKPEKLLHRASD